MLAQTFTLLNQEGRGPISEVLPGPFAARVRGRDQSGGRFDLQCVVESLSADYLFLELECLPLKPPVEAPSKLFIVTRIYRATIAVRGCVLRVEQVSEVKSRLEVEIRSHRFLPMSETVEMVLS